MQEDETKKLLLSDKMKQFGEMFQVCTGVSMERALDLELAGKHNELLVEIDQAIKKELRPELCNAEQDEAARERAREADIGGNLPANFMDKFK